MEDNTNQSLPLRAGGSSNGPPRHNDSSSASSQNGQGTDKSASATISTNSRPASLAPLPPLPVHLSSSTNNNNNERSALLPRQNDNNQTLHRQSFRLFNHRGCSISCISATGVIIMTLAIFMATWLATGNDDDDDATVMNHHWLLPYLRQYNKPKPYYTFPDHFLFGVATSSYQIEGAVYQDGRGESIWDTFCQKPGVILDGSDGSIACDAYHRLEQDVALMASLNIQAYRFSIAWPRILPHGTGTVNPAGLKYYNHLINLLLRYEIEPWATLFHWDLPQTLMTDESTGGWLNTNTSEAFAEYASVCFEAFGDRVKNWITINEAWTVAVNGHATGIHAPGHQSTTEPYIVGHNLLLAHGLAVQAFREYQNRTNTTYSSRIGIANCGDFRYPTTVADNHTAERVMLFQVGWFTDPLFFGDYPAVMRDRLGERLPVFTSEQRELLVGSVDFVGLNYYSSLQASTPTAPPTYQGYWTSDINANLHAHPNWRLNDMGWAVVPDGLRNILEFLSSRYQNPLLYITENGDAEHRDSVKPLADTARQDYLQGHIRAVGQAMELGVNVGGYFAWSLMDNFEWQFGYTKKFGLVKVDFADGSLRRTPKGSAHWYNQTILSRGRNIPRAPPLSWWPSF